MIIQFTYRLPTAYRVAKTPPAKQKISVTLDADLVAALKANDSTTLSAQVNTAVRAEVARRMRSQALGEYLSRLGEERGPLDTPEDEAEIARYMRLLGEPSDAVEQDASAAGSAARPSGARHGATGECASRSG